MFRIDLKRNGENAVTKGVQLIFAAILTLAADLQARAQAPVELELALAVDVSSSVTLKEYRFQMAGIAAAFRHPEIIAVIEDLQPLGIAACLIHWAGGFKQNVAVDWMVLKDMETARQFASMIANAERSFLGDTSIGRALEFSATQIETNTYLGSRKTIDLSGDGDASYGVRAREFRDKVVEQGITINALAILTDDPDLDLYYRDNIIGGPNSFVMTAADHVDFRKAIRHKLHREIVPPTAMNLPVPPRHAGLRAGESGQVRRQTYSTLPNDWAQDANRPELTQPLPPVTSAAWRR